jgi:hypothetical protein
MDEYQYNLYIAGVHLRSRSSQPLQPWADPVYDDFMVPGDGMPPDVGVDIEVIEGIPDDLQSASPQLTADDSWTLRRNGDQSEAVSWPPSFDTPLWVTRFNDTCNRVTAFCGEALRHNDGPLPTPIHYPLDQILVVHALSARQGLLLHAAAIVLHEKLWIFCGRSGAGKSTLSRLLADAGCDSLITDDRVMVRRRDNGWVGCGTPWAGEARIGRNRCAPVGGVFILHKGNDTFTRPLTPADAAHQLYPVTSLLWHDPQRLPAMLESCDGLVNQVPFAELHFANSADSAKAVLSVLSNQ